MNKIILGLLFSLFSVTAHAYIKENNIEFCKGGSVPLFMDVGYPQVQQSGSLPVIVFIHGGGWRGGTRQSMKKKFFKEATGKGYFAATIDYRLTAVDDTNDLATGAHYMNIIRDVKCSIRFLKANAEKFGIDPERIAVFGTSAGGHLALTTGLNRNPREDKNGQYQNYDSSVAAVVNWFGPCELALNHALSNRSKAAIEALLQSTPEEKMRRYVYASPITHISADSPPVITLHGTLDSIVPYQTSVNLDARAKEVGANHELVTIEGGRHGLNDWWDPTINQLARAASYQFLDNIFF